MNSETGGTVASGSGNEARSEENGKKVDPVDLDLQKDSTRACTKEDDDCQGHLAFSSRLIPHPMGKLMWCPVCKEKFYDPKYLSVHLTYVHLDSNSNCGKRGRGRPRKESSHGNRTGSVKRELSEDDEAEDVPDPDCDSDAETMTDRRTLRRSTRANTKASRPQAAELTVSKKSKKKQLPVAGYRTKGQYLYAKHAKMFSNEGEDLTDEETCDVTS